MSGPTSDAKRLLLIAFHVPPVQGSTGVTRTLAFAKYLREYGWDVTLLTASALAHPEIRWENMKQVPAHVRVVRAWALDTQRHCSIFGRYPWWLASPDRWRTWYWPAVLRGLSLVRSWRPHALMSTYPIATAHGIGAALAAKTGLPWIADFRDPMAQEGYPEDPRIHRAFERIERDVFGRAQRVLVTTEGAASMYRERFPSYPAEHIKVISNGFDPEMFPSNFAAHVDRAPGPLRLLHSGALYPSERDPTEFFAAVSELRHAGVLDAKSVQFLFRAPGNEARYAPRIAELGIADLVKLLPQVPYQEALNEMTQVDAFMLFQASNCNDQIPAKLYEYWFAQKPILGLTDPRGETARLMMRLGSTCIANLHDRESIKRLLPQFLRLVRETAAPIPAPQIVQGYSRRNLTGDLAAELDAIISPLQSG